MWSLHAPLVRLEALARFAWLCYRILFEMTCYAISIKWHGCLLNQVRQMRSQFPLQASVQPNNSYASQQKCVWVCESVRERVCVCVCVCVWESVCVCVCERESVWERERERERERESGGMYIFVHVFAHKIHRSHCFSAYPSLFLSEILCDAHIYYISCFSLKLQPKEPNRDCPVFQ